MMKQNIVHMRGDQIIYIKANDIKEFIEAHSRQEKFALILFIGQSVGKSTLIQELSGVEQEIGDIYHSKTTGAVITYAGKVSEIYNRLKAQSQKVLHPNLNIYFIETEAIYGSCPNEIVTKIMLPFCHLSGRIITCIDKNEITSNAQFLSLLNKHLFLRYYKREENQYFVRKLTLFIRDIPNNDDENVSYEESATNLMNAFCRSDLIKTYEREGFIPNVVFGGKFTDNHHRNKNLIVLFNDIISNIDQNVIFNSPKDLSAHINCLEQSNEFFIKFCGLNQSKVLTEAAETIALEFTRSLSESPNLKTFQELQNHRDEAIREFNEVAEQNGIHPLKTSIPRRILSNKINQTYTEYMNMNNLIDIIHRSIHIQGFFDHLSTFVQQNAQNTANNIFSTINSKTCSFSEYRASIDDEINNARNQCIQMINNLNNEEKTIIANDINSIFNFLSQYPTFTLIREHGVISSIVRYFKDAPDTNPVRIIPDVRRVECFMNTYSKKYQSINIMNRNYLILLRNHPKERKYFDIVNNLRQNNIPDDIINYIISQENPYNFNFNNYELIGFN